MFKKINFLLVAISLASCVPISETTKSKLEFKEKIIKDDTSSDTNPSVTLTPAELKVSVRKILDSNCLSCHGTGESYQALADLAPSISEIEKDSRIVAPKDLVGSLIYQQVTVGSMKNFLQNPNDADIIKAWILSLVPEVIDTKAPLITSFSPNGLTYEMGISSVKLSVVTNEAASCAFSQNSASVNFNQMTKFTGTGDKSHTYTASNLQAGSYSYFVKCMDVALNQSIFKEIKFTIKELVILTPAELKVAVRQILDTNCLVCHGAGKSFQSIANLAPSISVIEQDPTLVSAKSLENSFIYQQVTVGKMKAYLPNTKDKDIMKDWILSLVPIPVDIKAPVITSFLPNGASFDIGVSSAKLDVVTDENASCGFSNSASNLDYNQMTKFSGTGAKVHTHTATGLKAGSYSYFVKCIDAAKNESLSKEIKFTIKGVVSPPPADQGSGHKDYNSEVQMGNRSYIESILQQVFDVKGSSLQSYLQTNIFEKIEFGGACDIYAGSDDGNWFEFMRERCFNDIGVVQPANNNPMRYALTTKVCERLVSDSGRLNAVRNKIFSDQKWRMPTNDKILVAWHLFNQASDTDTNVLNSLRDISLATKSNDEAWKVIVLTLCISPEWQVH